MIHVEENRILVKKNIEEIKDILHKVKKYISINFLKFVNFNLFKIFPLFKKIIILYNIWYFKSFYSRIFRYKAYNYYSLYNIMFVHTSYIQYHQSHFLKIPIAHIKALDQNGIRILNAQKLFLRLILICCLSYYSLYLKNYTWS